MRHTSSVQTFSANAIMGGEAPHDVLNSAAKKKLGFHLTQVEDATQGKVVAVDASAFMHGSWNSLTDQQLYEEAVKLHETRKKNTPLILSQAFIQAIVQKTVDVIDFLTDVLKFREVKFVYDGQRFHGKGEEKEDRMRKCDEAFAKATLTDRTACKDSMFLVWEMYKVSIGAAIAAGVRCYVAIGEADPQIAYMCLLREADIAFFEDSDLWVHGVRRGVLGMLSKRWKIGGKEAYEGCYIDVADCPEWFSPDGNTGMSVSFCFPALSRYRSRDHKPCCRKTLITIYVTISIYLSHIPGSLGAPSTPTA
jgi:XPG I-region